MLVVYAICAPVLIAWRNQPPRLLFGVGVGAVLLSAVLGAVVQTGIGADGEGLGTYWFLAGDSSDAVDGWLISDFFLRGLGMMLIGVALYRTGVVTGERSARFYRRLAAGGLGLGLPLAALGFALVATDDFSPDFALIGAIPNTVATIPVVLGYLSLIALWDAGGRSLIHRRIRLVGRMALTNYLTQTIIGVIVLRVALDWTDLSRSWIFLFVLAVWALQLLWSEPWLSRYRFGPFEWLWRSATYRRWQPLHRETR